jgi:hypothetical protein
MTGPTPTNGENGLQFYLYILIAISCAPCGFLNYALCDRGEAMESRLMKQFVFIMFILFCWTLVILLVTAK